MLVKTEKISSSLRRRSCRRYVLCAVEGCSKLEALRRRTRGRRVSSKYVAQRWTATVPTSDQLCCWRWKSGRRVRRDKMVLLHRDSGELACRACTAHAVWWATSDATWQWTQLSYIWSMLPPPPYCTWMSNYRWHVSMTTVHASRVTTSAHVAWHNHIDHVVPLTTRVSEKVAHVFYRSMHRQHIHSALLRSGWVSDRHTFVLCRSC